MNIRGKDKSYLLGHFFSSRWLVFFALSLVCLLAYFNSFQNNFMLDDHLILFGQRGVINKPLSAIFTSNQGDFYRPMGHVPLWVFSRAFGSNPTPYHIANFFLFVFMVFLMFVIVRKITSNDSLAFLSALLYGVHPLNAMIINYITASIIAVFVLSMQLSFLFFINFLEQAKKRDYALSLISFISACLSHEMAIMLPLYLLAYLFFIKKESWLKIYLLILPFVLIIIGWVALRVHLSCIPTQFNKALFVSGNLASSFSTWMNLVVWYLSNLFLPNKIIFLWSNPYGQQHLLRNLVIFVLAFGLTAFALFKWRRSWKSCLLIIFVLGFSPTVFSCFVNFPKVQPIIEPHWFYFSQIGFFVLLAWCLLALARRNFVIGTVISGSAILLFLIYCWSYNDQWKNEEKYSLYWLSLNTGNLTPYYGLGRALMDRGDYHGAATFFSEGYRRLNYGTAQMGADWGHSLDMMGYNQVALSWLLEAARRDNHYALTYHYIGLYYNKRGNLLEAEKAFKTAVKLDPNFSPSRMYLK